MDHQHSERISVPCAQMKRSCCILHMSDFFGRWHEPQAGHFVTLTLHYGNGNQEWRWPKYGHIFVRVESDLLQTSCRSGGRSPVVWLTVAADKSVPEDPET